VLALALMALGFMSVAGVLSGCGAHKAPRPAALRLERADLVAVGRALVRVEGPIGREVAATKLAWPLVVNGLSATVTSSARATIAAAAASAARIRLPALFHEAQAASLTGPSAELAGLVRTYVALVTPGWKLIAAAIDEIEHGSPAAARFARANVGLYIEGVYDGHFTLAQLGKHLLDSYHKLGGPAAFATSLNQQEVDLLVSAYSEASDRLHPHDGVRLGS
jgi:hypothetical protein